MNDDDRLLRIEAKLAYQEDLLLSLNDTVADQQQQMDRLKARIEALIERSRAGNAEGFVSEEHERPPHY